MTSDKAQKVLHRMLGRDPKFLGTACYDQGIHIDADIQEQREAIKFALDCISRCKNTESKNT